MNLLNITIIGISFNIIFFHFFYIFYYKLLDRNTHDMYIINMINNESRRNKMTTERIEKRIEMAKNITNIIDNSKVWTGGTNVRVYIGGRRRPQYIVIDDQAIDDNHVDIDNVSDFMATNRTLIKAGYIPFRGRRMSDGKDAKNAREYAKKFLN